MMVMKSRLRPCNTTHPEINTHTKKVHKNTKKKNTNIKIKRRILFVSGQAMTMDDANVRFLKYSPLTKKASMSAMIPVEETINILL